MIFYIAIIAFLLNFIFIDWTLAVMWILIERIYSKEKDLSGYKKDVRERRELIKNSMIERVKEFERFKDINN